MTTFFMLLIGTTVSAQAVKTFKCGSVGEPRSVTVHFAGPRYADRIELSDFFDKELLSLASTQDSQPYSLSLAMGLSVGQCSKGGGEGSLVECQFDESVPSTWAHAHLGVTTTTELSGGYYQTNNIVRDIRLKSMKMELIKKDQMVILKAHLVMATSEKDHVEVIINKSAGTYESGFHRCEFGTDIL